MGIRIAVFVVNVMKGGSGLIAQKIVENMGTEIRLTMIVVNVMKGGAAIIVPILPVLMFFLEKIVQKIYLKYAIITVNGMQMLIGVFAIPVIAELFAKMKIDCFVV